ncbi:hypothetical protein GOB57_22325 [Sinorhizobium meliloti]|nr:hypothetical protein [Sinorhizobium meliloti]
MPRMTLPFLTSSLASTGRTGKLKFGWAESQVDVEEADPSEFSLAACRVINAGHSTSIYENRGVFWASALYPVRGVLYNASGITGEAPFSAETTEDIRWIRVLAQEVLSRRLGERAKVEGTRLGKDGSGNIKITSPLKPGDGHESDRDVFSRWAADNLIMTGGRLMKRVHSPGVHIGWSFQNHSMTSQCTPIREAFYVRGYGKHEFDPGLYFRLGDPAFEDVWAETEEAFGLPTHQADHAHNRHYVRAIREELAANGVSDKMLVHDNVVYDPSVLATVSKDGWEDMAQRSAVSIAESIVATSSPHLHQPGSKRTALEELKRLVEIVPDNRPDDFQEALERALAALPTAGEQARAWFVNKALERWSDREISVMLAYSPIF